MNSMERIGAVLGGSAPDRRAFTLTLSLYGASLTGTPTLRYYAEPELYAAGQRAVVALCEPDVLFGPFALALEAQAFGAAVSITDRSPPTLKSPAYKSPKDVASLKRPDTMKSPQLRYLVDSLGAVVADQGGKRPVIGIIASPTDLPVLLLGMESWLDILLFQPDLARHWGALAVEHFESLAAAYFEAGASMLISPVELANPRILDRQMAERTMLPLLREAFGRLSGPIIFHHGGNRITENLAMFAGLPNLAGFVLGEQDSLPEARRILGKDTALLGTISGPHFSMRKPEDLAKRVRAILDERKDDPKFILASSGADIPYETPPENLALVRRLMDSPP